MNIGCLVMDRAVPSEATAFHQKENLGFRGRGETSGIPDCAFPPRVILTVLKALPEWTNAGGGASVRATGDAARILSRSIKSG